MTRLIHKLSVHSEEELVEKPAIEYLKTLGYDYIHGEELTPDSGERGTMRDAVLEKRLRAAVKKLNPWINHQNLEKVVRETIHVQTASLLEANEFIYTRLVQLISVDQDVGSGKKGQTVRIIDFDKPENNEFLVVNQFKIHGPKENIIPDILVFVNGLPLAVIECKAPYITDPMEAGITQLLRYMNKRTPESNEGCERLFWYNQFAVSTYRDKARIGTISSDYEHFLEWKDAYPALTSKNMSGQDILFTGVFTKKNFLDIVQSFTVFDVTDSGKRVKKIPRYPQFRAVHKTLERLKSSKERKKRGGVIWHTQGSGKSLTMVFLAQKIRRDPVLKDCKLVFVTDRKQLDRQLTKTFSITQQETVKHARSVREFKELLRTNTNDLVTGMHQKFQEEDFSKIEVLNESDRIICLLDEAHRGHGGALETVLNTALPNAPKIGFTGTPLVKSQKTTNEFGSYIDTYTIEQAVEDGATLQIVYEGRESKTKVTGESLDKLFDAYFAEKSQEERDEIKRKYGTELAILEAPKRIEMICIDILDHYRKHIQPNGFKAQIVTSSRRAAVLFKQTIDRLNGPEAQVVISGMHNDEDFFKPYSDPEDHKKYIDRFLKPMDEDQLSFLIVKDMLLTGFDAPIEQVMYLDRKLADHNLLQAIARVNRTAPGKKRGFIVDYYGLADYLQEALKDFTTDDVRGALVPLIEEIPKLEKRHRQVMGYFKKVDRSDIDDCVSVFEDEVLRQGFQADLKKFMESMDIVMPNPEAAPYLSDLKFLGLVSNGIRNRFRDESLQMAVKGAGEKVRKLIEDHVYSTGIDPKIPPIDLLATDFKKHVDAIKSPRARASEIEHAIKHHISVNFDKDPAYYRRLSEKLSEILAAQAEKWEELYNLLFDFRGSIEKERDTQASDLNLSSSAFAFFNALLETKEKLASAGVAMPENFDSELRQIAESIEKEVEMRTGIVDFFEKKDEVDDLRKHIRRSLLDTPFWENEKMRNQLLDSLMELAKAHFKR